MKRHSHNFNRCHLPSILNKADEFKIRPITNLTKFSKCHVQARALAWPGLRALTTNSACGAGCRTPTAAGGPLAEGLPWGGSGMPMAQLGVHMPLMETGKEIARPLSALCVK